MSKRRSQSFDQCPVFPQRRHVSGAVLFFHAASMSIGTGLPGDGLEWAKRAGGAVGTDQSGIGRRVAEVGGLVWQYEVWKASSAAQFWSIWTARWNQAFESMSEGLPAAIPARAVEIRQSRPRWNLTTMVLGLVYPESLMRSLNWSR